MIARGLRGWLLGIGSVLMLAAPASALAARVPTADESAALSGLIQGEMATCDLERAFGVALVTDDGTWGRVNAICGDPFKGGPGLREKHVWAHRSSPIATDWAIVGPTEPSGRCTGKQGLFTLVPATVVRDLRGSCRDPAIATVRRPAPHLELSVFPADVDGDVGSFILLSRGSAARNPAGILDYSPRLALSELTREFGRPRRTRCGATWNRFALTAAVCASGHVTKLSLGTGWQLRFEDDTAEALANPAVRVGDPVALARYLDPQLAGLTDHQRFALPKLHIGVAEVTITALTRGGRITAFQVAIRQRREAARTT